MKKRNIGYDLSLVIPAYREEEHLGNSLSELSKFIKHELPGLWVEVIVVIADSTDATLKIAQKHASKFKDYRIIKVGPKVGKGRDVRVGVLAAKGRYVFFMDADLATPLYHIKAVYRLFEHKPIQIVLGVRDLRKIHRGYVRKTVSVCGNLLFQTVSGIRINDSQCGFKAFSKNAAKICFTKQTIMTWGFDMELITIAKLHDLTMYQYRVIDWADIKPSTITNPLFTGLLTIGDLAQITYNRIRSVY